MTDYQRILVALDLSEGSKTVANRAISLARHCNATITLVHVVEYVPVEPMGEALLPSVQIEEGLVENAQTRLTQLAAELGLQEAKRVVEVGNIKSEVLRVAADTGADLIVLGARERHGVAVLLNFTEDTVLHAAPCDVLAVRLKRS